MRLGLEGRTAVVTGATSGIGRAVAVELATEGAGVVVVGRDVDRLDRVVQRVTRIGRQAWAVAADIATTAGTALVKDRIEGLGGVDILVNNAGGAPWGGLERFDDQQWRDGLRLKPLSYVRLTRDVLPRMKARRWGRIVNVGGVESRTAWPDYNLGMVSAAIIQAFTKSVSDEVAKFGISVSAVHPGPVDTPRLRKKVAWANQTGQSDLTVERHLDNLARETVLGRLGSPEDVAAAVTFLASERAGFITGASLLVDGGASRSAI